MHLGQTSVHDPPGPDVGPSEIDADDDRVAHAASAFFFLRLTVLLAMRGRAQIPIDRM